MSIARILMIPVVLSSLQAAATACEHCRAAAAAAAAQAAAASNPTDLAVAAIQTAGRELRQSISTRKLLCTETEKLTAARAARLQELQSVAAQLLAIKTHVHSGEYPLVLGDLIIRDEATAHRAASELLFRHDSLSSIVDELAAELEAGEAQRLQLNRRIQQTEAEILLAQHRSARIQAASTPKKSSLPLAAFRITTPPGTASSSRQQRLQAFLEGGIRDAEDM